MIWKDKVLTHREAFRDVLMSLECPDDAKHFRAVFNHSFPERSADLLGYLTADIKEEEEKRRVQELLEVKHPLVADKVGTMSAFISSISQLFRDPELSSIIVQIPWKHELKQTFHPTYKDPEILVREQFTKP